MVKYIIILNYTTTAYKYVKNLLYKIYESGVTVTVISGSEHVEFASSTRIRF